MFSMLRVFEYTSNGAIDVSLSVTGLVAKLQFDVVSPVFMLSRRFV